MSFSVQKGEIVGLIGPNGAGKTTSLDMLVGLARVAQGQIRLNGHSVVGLRPHRIAAYGMTKTFQNVSLFMESSVLDNVVIGALLRGNLDTARNQAQQVLERVGLSAVANRPAAELSFPERRRPQEATMSELPIDTLLRKQEFFAGLEADDIAFLAENAIRRPMNDNEILFKHGHRADRFYLVEDGEVSVEVVALTGPSLELQRLGPGEILGWSWLIPPYRWNFQARAERAGAIIEFSGERILERCEADYRFGYALFQRFSALMSRRLSEARTRMMEEWNPPGFA